jgi:DNA-damage-inducible protein J
MYERKWIELAKSTNLFVRIEPELKAQAESVLDQLGIPLSNAVTIFLKQVVMQKGLPFQVKLPTESFVSVSELKEAELNAELMRGYEDFVNGRTRPAKELIAETRNDYGL